MKKLTKTLSLVLVIAMVLSLCVVGVSAKTFSKDGDQIGDAYKEAVDVMSGIGIISGVDTEGTTFNPTGNFTRAEAAKIIAYMVLGSDAAGALPAGTSMFKDMGGYAWAVPFVNYCAQQGIINGTGDGNFAPAAKLTGYAFAKMLLCAVGYGANKEYTGNGWDLKVAKDAVTLGVFTGDMTGATKETINREQAVLYAFNTLTNISKVSYSALYGTYVAVQTTVVNGTVTTLSSATLGVSVYNLYRTSKTGNEVTFQKATASGSTKYAYCINAIAVTADKENLGHLGYVWYTVAPATGFDTAVSSVYYLEKELGSNTTGKSVAELTNSSSSAFIAKANSLTYVVNGAVLDSYVAVPASDITVGTTSVSGMYTASTAATGVTSYTPASGTAVANTTYYVPAATAAAKYIKMGAKVTLVDVKGDPTANLFDGKAERVYIEFATPYVVTGSTYTVKAVDDTYIVVPGVVTYGANDDTKDNVDADTCVGYDGLVKGDVVLKSAWANGVTYLTKATAVTGKLASADTTTTTYTFKVDDKSYAGNGANQLVTNGDSRYLTTTAFATAYSQYIGKDATYYLDGAGYIVGVKPSTVSNSQVAYCIGAKNDTAYNSLSASAKLLLPDGTTETANVVTIGGNKVAAMANSAAVDTAVGTISRNLVQYEKTDAGYKLTVVGGAPAAAYYKYSNGGTTLMSSATASGTYAAVNDYVIDSKTIAYVKAADGTYSAYVGASKIPSLTATSEANVLVFADGTAKNVYAMFFATNPDTSTVAKYYGVVNSISESVSATTGAYTESVTIWAKDAVSESYAVANVRKGVATEMTELSSSNNLAVGNIVEYTIGTDGKISATVLTNGRTLATSSGATYGVYATAIADSSDYWSVTDAAGNTVIKALAADAVVSQVTLTNGVYSFNTTTMGSTAVGGTHAGETAYVIFNLSATGAMTTIAQVFFIK